MKRIIISSILLTVIIIAIFNINYTTTSRNAITPLSTQMAAEEINTEYKGLVIFAGELVADSKKDIDIKNNTLHVNKMSK